MTWTLGIIGCGKMAYALLKGICRDTANDLGAIYINEPDSARVSLFVNEFKAIPVSKEELINKSGVIMLAVKPNQVLDVLTETAACWEQGKLVVSIVAGMKTADLENIIAPRALRVIRVMPNTPCLAGEGMSAICPGSLATHADLQFVRALLESSGRTLIVPEKDMDAVTAVSGSGPAYVFLLVEAMIEAAVNVGLPVDAARQLVLQTMKGSICMLEESGQHPAVLKAQVCSPGGTTIAGVRQLEEGGVRAAFFNAIEAACERSISLGIPKK